MRLTTEQTQTHATAADAAADALREELRMTIDGLRQERKRRERANSAEPEARIDIEGITHEIDRLTTLKDVIPARAQIAIGVRLTLEPGWSTAPNA